MKNRLKFKLCSSDVFLTKKYYIKLFNGRRLIAEFSPCYGMFNKEEIADYCITHLGFNDCEIAELLKGFKS